MIFSYTIFVNPPPTFQQTDQMAQHSAYFKTFFLSWKEILDYLSF